MKGKRRFCIVGVLLLLLLSGCGRVYSEADLIQLRQKAYQEGYQLGYDEALEEQSARLEEQYQQGYDTGAQEGYLLGAQETQSALLEGIGSSYRQGYETGYSAGYTLQQAEEEQARLAYLAALSTRLPAVSAKSPDTAGSDSSPEPDTPVDTPLPEEPEEPSATGEVYVTASGTKYHRSSCAYLSKSRKGISLSEARSKGYAPCSKCKPPQ